MKIQSIGDRTRTHGMSRSTASFSPLYGIWIAMKSRCYNPNSSKYSCYGGRGITICKRWLKFDNFYADMIASYKSGLSIDRKNVNKNYTPSNSRWRTQKEQCNNKRNNRLLTYKGVTKTLTQFSEFYGVKIGTIHTRLKNGWSVDNAITLPPNRNRKKISSLQKQKQ